MNRQISLAFFGSSPNSLIVLKALSQQGYAIKLIITAPPRPVGRKKIITKTPIHSFAEKTNIPVETPEQLDQTFTKSFTSQIVDLAIVADYARLIPPKILNHPKRGFINLHPSLLPKYRGSTPVQTAILNGDQLTGMTILKMDELFDHGPIISQFKQEIKDTDTSEVLYKKLFRSGAETLITILPSWIEGKIQTRKQDHTQASLATRLSRQDSFIPWKLIQKAMQGNNITRQKRPKLLRKAYGSWPQIVQRSIRALNPWPGVWTLVPTAKAKQRLKIFTATIRQKQLELQDVQIEGKSRTTFKQLKTQILNS